MSAFRYAALDRNRLGQALLLDETGYQITTSEVCDFNRTVLGTLPARSGAYGFEIYFWSNLRGDLSDLASFGIATPSKNLGVYTGGDSNSFGFVVANGEIRSNDAVLATIDKPGERVPIGLRLSLAPSAASVEWLVNGGVVATTALPAGKTWLPAISIGSTVAGDVSAIINTGLDQFDALNGSAGWRQQRPGLSTFYLSVIGEGFMSLPTDSPANTPFGPYILNSKQWSILREPYVWWHRTDDRTNPAAVTTLRLDNSRGTFNALLRADAKDSTIVIQQVEPDAGGVGSLATATTVFTGILERAAAVADKAIDIVLRDTLSRFDVPLRMRKIPPFYDPSSAGRVVPLGLGAQRNVRPLLLSEPDRLYLLGDCPANNVASFSDQGAPLDPLALPPQYTPALNGAGVQLATLPIGRPSVDYSTLGTQGQLPPGETDALSGIGQFAVWPGPTGNTTTPPDHFTWTNNAGSLMVKTVSPPFAPGKNVLRIISSRPWYPFPFGSPPASVYGDVLATDNAPLLGGRAYRLMFKMSNVFSAEPGSATALRGGLMIRTALSNSPADAVSPHGVAISTAIDYRQDYIIDFRVPAGANRNLYFLAVASGGSTAGSHVGTGGAEIFDVRLQLLGQYEDAPPLEGIKLGDAFREILVNRMGEDPSVYSASDALALDAGYGVPIGIRYEDTPNVLDAMTLIADQSNAAIFTDEFGQIRIRALDDGGIPVAKFMRANVDLDTALDYPDPAKGLTTQWACRPSCTPFGDGDYVTDTTVVTPSTREQYSGTSQFRIDGTVQLAQEHAAAYGAGRRHTRIDDKRLAQILQAFTLGLFAGQRRLFIWESPYEGKTVGVDGITVPAQKLYPLDKVLVDIPEIGISMKEMKLLSVEHWPDDKRFRLIGWYKA